MSGEGDFKPLAGGADEEEVIKLAHQQPWASQPKGGGVGPGPARSQFQAVNNPVIAGAADSGGHPRQSTYDQWNERKQSQSYNQFNPSPLFNGITLRQIVTGLMLVLFFITFILSCVAISKVVLPVVHVMHDFSRLRRSPSSRRLPPHT